MPRGAAEWKDPLDRAAEIVREREAFIDELALQLEHEGELSASSRCHLALDQRPC